jgi:Tol biopolymer transport system component
MPRTNRLLFFALALTLLGSASPLSPAAGRPGQPSRGSGSRTATHVQNGRIAFDLDPGTGARIVSVTPHGTDLRTLVHYPHSAAEAPAWSPRGHRLVYSRVDDSGCHVILARPDGTHRRDLTRHRTGCESSPTFTPTGRRIVFVLQRCESCRTWIAAMSLSGTHRHRILAVAPNTTPEDVVLSPDGHRIAFESTFDPSLNAFHRALLVARRDGTHLHTLVPYRLDVGVHFDWSSTGRWLVYTRWSESPPGHEANVVLIRPDGSRQKRLTRVRRTGLSAGGATFSPDGRQIVYRFANADKGRFWLCTMGLYGASKTRIRELSLPPQGTAWAPTVH